MSLSVNIANDIPSKFILKSSVTATQAILRKDYIEFFPESQLNYSPGGDDEIRFNIAANDGFLIPSESYLKFDITLSNAAGAVYGDFRLARGGVNACFREVEHRSNNISNILHRSRYYNREFNLQMSLAQSKEHLERMGGLYADELSEEMYITDPLPSEFVGTLNANTTFNHRTDTVIVLAAATIVPIKIGDLMFSGAACMRVKSITNRTTFTVSSLNLETAPATTALAAGDAIFRTAHSRQNERYVAMDGTSHTYTMQLKTPIFDNIEALPLFVMKGGLHIYLQLEQAQNVIKRRVPFSQVAIGQNASYTISNIRYVARIATTHSQIKREYIDRFNSQGGIMYYIPGYFTQEIPITDGTNDNVQASFGVRSARHVIVAQQPNAFFNDSATSYNFENLSKSLKMQVTNYQFRIGSHQYPLRELICTNNRTSELYRQLFNVFDRCGSSNMLTTLDSARPSSTIRIEANNGDAFDADNFYLVADLSRDNSVYGELCGADVSLLPLQLELDRATTLTLMGYNPGTYFWHLFHDQYWRLNAGTQQILK